MLNKILSWLFGGRPLSSKLDPRRKVKIHGVGFTLRKLNPLEYLAGGQALKKVYDVYQRPDKSETVVDTVVVNKVKAHYTDVLMGGVVYVHCLGQALVPSRKPLEEGESGKIHIDNLMTDWDLAEQLYLAIMEFTYGKKKLRLLISPKKSLSTSIS